jgi:rubrerythrin
MAIDPSALDQALTRDIAAAVITSARPLRYRLGDAFLPVGTAPPTDARLRCCTCGYGATASASPTACPLCGAHAWELLPALAQSRLAR